MSIRTDLAIEEKILLKDIENKKRKSGKITVSITEIKNNEIAKKIQKPCGKYITIEFGDLQQKISYEEIKTEIIETLKELVVDQTDKFLIVGLGNTEITADAIGPKTAKKILATRHIIGEFENKKGLSGLKSVSVITPDVLGKTGIESAELIRSAVKEINPKIIIAIDACVSSSISRLFRTIQISNTGICPGSGVKNSRKELSFKTLGVPVIAIGIPTVVNASTLAFELTKSENIINTDLLVTPKDSDLLNHRLSEILAEALNVFLQPEIERDILFGVV